ncbi:hypothetical protein HAX54_030248, partial [Datura stramonium]|nr:hypothetical protein [Datura stramonium]
MAVDFGCDLKRIEFKLKVFQDRKIVTTLPHMRDQQYGAQALLHKERREAPAFLCDQRHEALAFQCNDMRDAAQLWHDTMREAQPIPCDARRDALTLSGCQKGNPTSARKRSCRSQIKSMKEQRRHKSTI